MAHECIHEDQIQGISRKTAELEARADFKDEKIAQILEDNQRMESKIDKLTETVNNLMLKSVSDDNNLNQRVTALEAEKANTRYMIGLSVIVLAGLEFILNYLR